MGVELLTSSFAVHEYLKITDRFQTNHFERRKPNTICSLNCRDYGNMGQGIPPRNLTRGHRRLEIKFFQTQLGQDDIG